MGLAPTSIFDPESGVVPTTTEACAVIPVDEVATAVYRVAVVGITFILPLVEPASAPLIITELAFVLLQLMGADVSAGFCWGAMASIVSTSFVVIPSVALR
jgi:hypothetical protein